MSKQFNNKFGKTATKAAIAIALVGATTVGAHAASKQAVTTANLHMRTGEGTGYKIVQTIKEGEQVSVLDNKGSWWKVEHKGKVGYSYKNYLRLVNNKQVIKEVRVSVDDALMVRTGASTSHKIIGRLTDGARLQVTGQKGNWYEINYKGNVAYVHSGYCKDINSNVNHNNNQSSNQGNETVKVTASRLMLRTGASTSHRIMDRLPRDTKLVVVDRLSNGWLKVMVNGKLGYVSGQYTVKINENNNTSESTNEKVNMNVKVTASSLNVRAGSSVAYAKKGYVHAGQELKAVEKASNGWYKVQLPNGDFGWISGRYADAVKTNENTNKPVVPPVVDNKPSTGEDTAKPVVPDTKPEDKPVTPDQKPDDTVKPGDDTTKPEDKPNTGETTNPEDKPSTGETTKPEDKPSTGEDTTKPVNPDVKPDENPGKDDPELIPPTNQAPRIHFTNVTLNQGEKFTKDMLNIDAFDLEDGKIPTDKVQMISDVDTNKPGAYTVTLKVADKEGYETTVYAVVTVKAKEVANEGPKLFVEGTTVEQGTEFNYNMLKYSAEDKEDGNLTNKVEFSGDVNTNKPGTYEVNASVSDSKGVTTKTTVKVVVTAKNNAPVINCVDTYTMSPGDKFDVEMLGATAHDKEDGDLTNKINLTGTVKDEVGTYHVKLTVTDSKGVTTTKDVTVNVIKRNEAPVINVADTYTLTQGDKFDYSMLKATVTDDYDKDLSIQYKGDVNTNKPGEYRVSVYATDSQDMIGQKWVTVIVKAPVVQNEAPVLTASDVTLNQGEGFSIFSLNINAQDKEDGNITKQVHIVSNNVDTNKPGTYKVELSVTDSKGATATKTVTVTVKAKETETNLVDKLNSSAFKSQVRAEMLSLVNAHRTANGLTPYKELSRLDGLANAWSKYQADNSFCDHTNGSGQTSDQLFPSFGGAESENVLMIGANASTTPQELANNMFKMWKASSGHNAAMLDDWMYTFGFGYYATQDSYGNINIYATQEFSAEGAPEAPKPEAPKAPEVKEEVKEEVKTETPAKEEVKAETPAPVVKDEVKVPAKEEVKAEVKTETPAPVVKEEVKTPAKEEVKQEAPVETATDANVPVETATK